MMSGLYEGAYGVSRGGKVLGPVQKAVAACKSPDCQECRQYPWRTNGSTYTMFGQYVRGEKNPRDFIAVFDHAPTPHEIAEAMNPPGRVRKALAFISPVIVNRYGVVRFRRNRIIAWAVVLAAALLFFGCRPTEPAEEPPANCDTIPHCSEGMGSK